MQRNMVYFLMSTEELANVKQTALVMARRFREDGDRVNLESTQEVLAEISHEEAIRAMESEEAPF